MDTSEMHALLAPAIDHAGGTWADLGAGSGNFTRVLSDLVGPAGVIYAVDRSAHALRMLMLSLPWPGGTTIRPVVADIRHQLNLPPLDGVLLANVLHFVEDQPALLGRLARALLPHGKCVVVEYELTHNLGWTPFPVPFERWALLVAAVGFKSTHRIGRRRSPRTGIEMYAALAVKEEHGA